MDDRARKRADRRRGLFGNHIACGEVDDFPFDAKMAPCNTPTTAGGGDCSVSTSEYVRDPGQILSLQPWIFKRSARPYNAEVLPEQCRNDIGGLTDHSAVEPFPNRLEFGSWPGRGQSALRSRRTRKHFMKPLDSAKNCLIPQLYGDDFEIEAYTAGSFPLPDAKVARPLIVTDGSRVISRSSYTSQFKPPSFRDYATGAATPLLDITDPKQSRGATRDLLDPMLLFSGGVSIGILFSALLNRKEVDKLNSMLEQKESLVQDLQEELELKDSLTVKELPDEAAGNQKDGDGGPGMRRVDSMSKIEAELQAELERLELNMGISNPKGTESPLHSEVDAESVGDVICGDLNTDKLIRGEGLDSSHGEVEWGGKSSSTGCARETDYPISPRNLSLRLHEVIQRRLEERIKELESMLAQTQRQLMLAADAERVFSERTLSNSDMGSSSNQESPMVVRQDEDGCTLAQPLCIALSGDALKAYDEAYEEFLTVADSGNSHPCYAAADSKDVLQKCEWRHRQAERNLFWGDEALDRGVDEPEEFEEDDEGKMLIQQIVKRTRQGSATLLQAQRLLFSLDE